MDTDIRVRESAEAGAHEQIRTDVVVDRAVDVVGELAVAGELDQALGVVPPSDMA